MRTALTSLLLAAAAGCGGADASPEVERIEIRRSGWSALDISVDRSGEGRFERGPLHPEVTSSGSFRITAAQFERLRDRLEPFRRQAVPWSEESVMRFIDQACPEGVPFVTDHGAVYIRWTGADADRHYLADLGCDRERHAARNSELLAIVGSLPVPLD